MDVGLFAPAAVHCHPISPSSFGCGVSDRHDRHVANLGGGDAELFISPGNDLLVLSPFAFSYFFAKLGLDCSVFGVAVFAAIVAVTSLILWQRIDQVESSDINLCACPQREVHFVKYLSNRVVYDI